MLFCHTGDTIKLEHQVIIRNNYVFLVDTTDSRDSGLIAYLFAAKVLDQRDKEDIESETNSFRRNEKLLSLLCRKSPDDFQRFLVALKMTRQEHVWSRLTEQPSSAVSGTI